MIFIVVKQRVRPEYADDWPALMAGFTAATRAEPGNITFEWSRSVEDPLVYLLVEAFQDGAGQAHVESAHFQEATKLLPRYLSDVPEIVYVETPGDGWSRMSEFTPES